VVEEKVDGANAALSFSPAGHLLLQSRGHYLVGGPRERHFDLFKQWAHGHAPALRGALGDQYILFGEWLFARHTIFYNHLPHYFLEFDILDRQTGDFLSTELRRKRLSGLPVESVPVLAAQKFPDPSSLTGLVSRSTFIRTGHLDDLRHSCRERGIQPERAIRETDPSELMEGLYVKVEEDGRVTGRFKYIRPSFLNVVQESGSHWLDRPIVPNQLALFG